MDGTKSRRRKRTDQDVEKGATHVKKGKVTPSPSPSPPLSSCDQPAVTSSPNPGGNPAKHRLQFYNVPCVDLAKKLLGQFIVRSIGTEKIKAKIVETESYLGPIDKAAHSYKGKKTPRNTAMFMSPGTSYVYNIYGMYCCLNISSQGDGAAVLIRALEPLEGQDLMTKGRKGGKAAKSKTLKEKELCNGPSKLCQALHITKNDFDQVDLTSSNKLWLETGPSVGDEIIVSCPRINIGYADDWIDKPLRFYVLGNSCVSVKDKKAEKLLEMEKQTSCSGVDNT